MNQLQFDVLAGVTFGVLAGLIHTSLAAFLFYAVVFSILFVVGDLAIFFVKASFAKHQAGEWPWEENEGDSS